MSKKVEPKRITVADAFGATPKIGVGTYLLFDGKPYMVSRCGFTSFTVSLLDGLCAIDTAHIFPQDIYSLTPDEAERMLDGKLSDWKIITRAEAAALLAAK